MADAPLPEIEKLIDSALNLAVRTDGPMKLFCGKSGKDGLFPGRTGIAKQAADFGFGSSPPLWSEEHRIFLNSPLFVRLLPGGLERLIEKTKPGSRAKLIRSASPIYRQTLLERWADIAAARGWKNDFPKIADCCSEMIDRLHGLIPEGSKVVGKKTNGSTQPGAKLSNEDADFKRRMAHELVVAWKYAPTSEAKQSIANALKNSGVEQIGKPSERLKLDGGLHRCEDPAFPGDEVEVVESGWLVHDGIGEYLLEKAIVKLI